MNFTVAILAVTGAIILIFQQVYEFTAKIKKHQQAEEKYYKIFYKIQSQLQAPRAAREDGKTFYEWIIYNISDISQIEDIDGGVLSAYKKEFPNQKVPGVDSIKQVVINVGSEPTDETTSTEDTDNDSPGKNNDIEKYQQMFKTRRYAMMGGMKTYANYMNELKNSEHKYKLRYEINRAKQLSPGNTDIIERRDSK
jgi:hypothetical protein